MTFEDFSFLPRDARRDSAFGERTDRDLPASVEDAPQAKREAAFALKAHEPTPASWPRVFPGL